MDNRQRAALAVDGHLKATGELLTPADAMERMDTIPRTDIQDSVESRLQREVRVSGSELTSREAMLIRLAADAAIDSLYEKGLVRTTTPEATNA